MRGYKFTFDNSFNTIPSVIRVDSCRQGLLASIEQDEILYKAFNFHEKGFPDVIYQKPHNNTWCIYMKGGSLAFDEANHLVTHLFKHPLSINAQTYKMVDFDEIRNITILPSKTEHKLTYQLITPLILFSSEHFPMYYSILKKHNNDNDALQEELKDAAKRLIVSNLKFQLQQQLKYKKFEALDDVDIEWLDFTVKFGTFHRAERKTPMIFGRFKSTYELPRFIGQKIGKGFGQINLIRAGA